MRVRCSDTRQLQAIVVCVPGGDSAGARSWLQQAINLPHDGTVAFGDRRRGKEGHRNFVFRTFARADQEHSVVRDLAVLKIDDGAGVPVAHQRCCCSGRLHCISLLHTPRRALLLCEQAMDNLRTPTFRDLYRGSARSASFPIEVVSSLGSLFPRDGQCWHPSTFSSRWRSVGTPPQTPTTARGGGVDVRLTHNRGRRDGICNDDGGDPAPRRRR